METTPKVWKKKTIEFENCDLVYKQGIKKIHGTLIVDAQKT